MNATKTMKTNELKAIEKSKKLKTAVTGAALLASTIFGAGCGDTINNYYYFDKPDGGAVSDSRKSDSGTKADSKSDSLKGDFDCTPAKVSCLTNTNMGILNQGEALIVSNLKVQLDDLEAHGNVSNAILSVINSCGNVLKKLKVAEGTTVTFAIDGQNMSITAKTLAPGYTFGAKWAELYVDMPCNSDAGSSKSD